MHRIIALTLLVSFLSPTYLTAQPAKAVPGEGAPGEWAGALKIGAVQLRLSLHVSAGDDGKLKGSLDSLDQGALGIGIDTISFEERTLNFQIKAIAGSFSGKMNEDGSAIEGTWSQGGMDLPLTFHRGEKAFTLNRPQEPKPPYPYESKDVAFPNEEAGIKLAGTLITPKGEGPFPAVLFVTGSGAQDRDESLMGHKPFWVIADYLARRGVASLRFDDRGFGKSEGDHMNSSVGDFASDAVAGASFLAAQPKIDRKALGIIGHSEGGLSGPMAALKNPEIRFLVLLAPPGEPLEELIKRQSRDGLALLEVDPELVNKALAHQDEDFKLIRDKSIKSSDLKAKLRQISQERIKGFSEEEKKKLGFNEQRVEQNISLVTTPWFRSLVREDPSTYLEQLKIPILALLAEKDVQVSAQVNEKFIVQALKAGANPDHEVKILPGLNHLFQHAETGAISEYGEIEETFAPKALQLIGDWITKRFGAK